MPGGTLVLLKDGRGRRRERGAPRGGGAALAGRGWVPSKMFSLPCQAERVETLSPERGLVLILMPLYQWGENCLMKEKGAR